MNHEPEIQSYSRLSSYETCPKRYELHYVTRGVPEPGDELAFGSAVHKALELLLRDAKESDRVAPLSIDRALAYWQDAWTESGLRGVSLFHDGATMIRRFVQDAGVVDGSKILGVEERFRLRMGDRWVQGVMDLVVRIDDDTIEVVDHKTNRQLFSREDVDGSLQMDIYAIAVAELYPWAKNVRLTFGMLRHGVRMPTTRSPARLEAARLYIEALASAMESAKEFPARPGTNCVYCDHRRDCAAYADALAGKRTVAAGDEANLVQLGREREEVARVAKIAYARKEQIDRLLKKHLEHRDELVLGSVRYAMLSTARTEYPLDRTVSVLLNAAGDTVSRDELVSRLGAVDKDALDAVLTDLEAKLPKAAVDLARVEIDAYATKTYSPRLWAKELKGARS